jgi:hypothetical protein
LSYDFAAERRLSTAALFQQLDLAFLLTEKQASYLVAKIVRADQQSGCFKSAVAGSRLRGGLVVKRDEITLSWSKEVLMRLPFRAIALPILSAAVLVAAGCQEANEAGVPDVKVAPEPGAKTTFSSYGEAMQHRAAEAAKDKAAAKDKSAPAKIPAEKSKS